MTQSETQSGVPDQDRAEAPVRRRGLALAVLAVGMLMDLLDTSVVNTVLPRIGHDLDTTSSALQWMIAGYALPFAIGMITGGRLGDLYGRKRLFMTGLLLFVAASLLCAVAQTGELLVAFRVAQGLSAALMVPQVIATIQVMYAPHERARPLTVAAAMYAVSSMIGPFVGAVLTESNIAGLGWRLVFLINVPVGLVVLLGAVFLLPESRARTTSRLDFVGMALLALALLLLLYPLAVGAEQGWPLWTIICMVLSVPALALFVLHQRNWTNSPLVPMRLFRHRSFSGGTTILAFGFATVYGFLLAFTIYLQDALGYGVLAAGIALVWWGLAAPIAGGIGLNLLAPRFGRGVIQVGLVAFVLAMVAMLLVMQVYGPDAGPVLLALPLVLGGIGGGLSLVIVVDFAISEVPVDDAGAASGVLNTAQQVGAAIGASAIAGLYFSLLPTERTANFAAEASNAFGLTMLLPMGMMTLALLASFWLPRSAGGKETPSAAVAEPHTTG